MNLKCSVNGCEKKQQARGFCAAHYQRFRQGKPVNVPLQVQHHGLSKKDRFEKWFSKSGEGDCWIWIGSFNNKGYGQFNFTGTRPMPSNRAAWMIYRGEIPDGMNVCHSCDTPACVNPDHLFLGSQQDNVDDMHNKGRARKRGLPGVEHGMSKVNDDIVRQIRGSADSDSILAKRYGVSRPTVWAIRARRTWAHIE